MNKSKFNKIFDYNGHKLAFNARTCALAEIDEDFIRIYDAIEHTNYNDLNNQDKELVDNMIAGCYLVSESSDELEILKLYHNKAKFRDHSLHLTIALTLDCNFGCPYCFENPQKGMIDGFISQEVQEKLVAMVKENAERRNNLTVSWYGGEPMLAKKIMYDLARRFISICAENGVKYQSTIVTNGYLITDEDIELFKECKIEAPEITIDGPEAIHNSRRFIKNSPSKGTFSRIIENIRKLCDAGIGVYIRTNIDKTNIESTKELITYLLSLNLQKMQINFGPVSDATCKEEEMDETYFTMSEYSKVFVELHEFLIANGYDYPPPKGLYYPTFRKSFCGATTQNNYVIDPKGYKYKCWNEAGDVSRSVGNITWEDDQYTDKMLLREAFYLTNTPFERESCRDCSILPICMGGCPLILANTGEAHCEKWKYSLEETLISAYTQKVQVSL